MHLKTLYIILLQSLYNCHSKTLSFFSEKGSCASLSRERNPRFHCLFRWVRPFSAAFMVLSTSTSPCVRLCWPLFGLLLTFVWALSPVTDTDTETITEVRMGIVVGLRSFKVVGVILARETYVSRSLLLLLFFV